MTAAEGLESLLQIDAILAVHRRQTAAVIFMVFRHTGQTPGGGGGGYFDLLESYCSSCTVSSYCKPIASFACIICCY